MITFQDLVMKLQEYWSRQGCILAQPYDLEVGAGTMHPATFLRVLGAGALAGGLCGTLRRPTDGRYGENPNRLQHYYQFQVILKPSPADVQEMYLESLKELGISGQGTRHQIRGGQLGISHFGRLGPGLGSLA